MSIAAKLTVSLSTSFHVEECVVFFRYLRLLLADAATNCSTSRLQAGVAFADARLATRPLILVLGVVTLAAPCIEAKAAFTQIRRGIMPSRSV